MRIWLFLILFPLLGLGLWLWNGFLQPGVSVLPVERGRAVDAALGVVQVSAKQDFILRAPASGQVINGGAVGAILPQKVDALAPLVALNTAHLDQQIQSLEKELSLLEGVRKNDPSSEEVNALEAEMRFKIQSLYAQKEHCKLMSPFQGTVVEAYVNPGDWVEPGMPLVRILSQNQIIEAELDEGQFRSLQVGQEAQLYFSARPDEVLKGKVKSLPALADASTRTFRVPIEIDLPEGYLIPGMTGHVSIVKAEHPEALLVPRRAVWGNKIWVMNNGKLESRPITMGFKGPHYVEVIEGLSEGDQIVADELHRCKEGRRVKVKTIASL